MKLAFFFGILLSAAAFGDQEFEIFDVPSRIVSLQYQPSFDPTLLPTTAEPTLFYTEEPTSPAPTEEPTPAPTEEPTSPAPTEEPTTAVPTEEPTLLPTEEPTTAAPTEEPTTPSPTVEETPPPTLQPVIQPPTRFSKPTRTPTAIPTRKPTTNIHRSSQSSQRSSISAEHITIIVCVISGIAGFFGCSYYYYSLEQKKKQKITELEHEIEGQNHVFEYPEGTTPALFSQESPRFSARFTPRSDEAVLIDKSSPRWSIFSHPAKTHISLSATNPQVSSTKVSTI